MQLSKFHYEDVLLTKLSVIMGFTYSTNGNPNRRTIDHGGVAGRASSDEFGRAVSRIAVAQICESAGFNGVKNAAIEALSDVTIRYLIDLGKIAEFYANLAGRSQCSVFDLILGLEDLE